MTLFLVNSFFRNPLTVFFVVLAACAVCGSIVLQIKAKKMIDREQTEYQRHFEEKRAYDKKQTDFFCSEQHSSVKEPESEETELHIFQGPITVSELLEETVLTLDGHRLH